MEQIILNLLQAYGPFAVLLLLLLSGFGIPLAEDPVIIPAGVMVGTGHLGFWSTAMCAWIGVLAADLLWFSLCSRYGTPLLHKRAFKRLVHPRRLLQCKHQLEQRGVWMIVMARFIPGSRTPAITTAGVLRMPFWHFALAEVACVSVTVPLQLGTGMLVAHGLGTLDDGVVLKVVLAVIALTIASIMVLSWWLAARQRRRRMPRAKAAWLRRFRTRRTTGTDASDASDAIEPAGKAERAA